MSKKMPTMTRQQLIDAINAERIAAVTLDTTVFDSKQKDFRRKDFRSISQIRTRNTPVLITDVIASEMMAHLEVEAANTQRALKTALRSNNLRWYRQSAAGEHTALFIDKDPEAFAKSEFDDFVKAVGAEVIKVADTPDGLAELFRRYFAVQTPFARKESRKQEFPDAAALLCLEGYAKAKGKLVICVAQDKAWNDFAAKSDHLVTVFPLTEALGIYSEAFKDADLADKIVELWLGGKETAFEEAVRDAIIARLPNWHALNRLINRVKEEKGIDLRSSDNRYHCRIKTGTKASSITRKWSHDAVNLFKKVSSSEEYELAV